MGGQPWLACALACSVGVFGNHAAATELPDLLKPHPEDPPADRIRRGHRTGTVGMVGTVVGAGLVAVGVAGAVRELDASAAQWEAGERRRPDHSAPGAWLAPAGSGLSTGVGAAGVIVGPVLLTTSSMRNARRIQRLAPDHSRIAGWIGVAGAATAWFTSSVAAEHPAVLPVTAAGFATALVGSSVQFGVNARAARTLGVLPSVDGSREPATVRMTVTPAGLALRGTF